MTSNKGGIDMASIIVTAFIYTILQLTESPWGRKWLKQHGGPKIEKRLLSYLDPASSNWRQQRMAEIALTATKLLVGLLCDTAVRRAVKRGTMNIFPALNETYKRQKKYGHPVPAFFVLNPTDECDMGCPVCYMDSRIKGSILPLWAMDRIVTEMKNEFGIHFVVVSGGEPFQKKTKLFALAQLHRDVAFMTYTNSSKITPSTVSMLARLGNIAPAISLEGYEQATDARRGKGYFRNMTELMRALKEAGVLFGFSATVTRNNADDLCSDEFIEFCIEQGCKFGWYFIYIPIGRGADCNLMVTTEQRSWLSSQVFKWLAEGRPIIIGDFWNGGPLVQGCIAGKYYFVVEADGSFGPCVFMPLSIKDTVYDIWAGRSSYTSLTEAICASPTFRKCRKHQAEITDHTSPCQVIDHPDMALKVRLQTDARVHRQKTPLGFFNPLGEFQQFLGANAKNWNDRNPREPHLVGSPYEHRVVP